MKNENTRIISFDILRVVSILYIIAFWHLDDYLEPANIIVSPLTITLTYCALNIFIFISGYLLFSKYGNLSTMSEIKSFLVKRMFRLYPLYVSALLLFYLMSLYDYKDFLCALFFCNIFISINIRTLWFISLIISYYFLIPVIAYKYSILRTFLIIALLLVVMIAVHEKFSIIGRALIEKRLILYMPSFVFGILAAKHDMFLNIIKNKLFALFSLAVLAASVYGVQPFKSHWLTYFNIPMYLSVSPLIIAAEYIAPKINKNIIMKLSYAAFGMYLYHRVVYSFLLTVYHPQTNALVILYLAFIGIPMIYILSKTVQRNYDKYISSYLS